MTGLINTAIGYAIFLLFLNQFNFKPEYANAAGYTIALMAAFVLNKHFVFNDTTFKKGMILKFILAFFIAFCINQAILLLGIRIINMKAEIAQLFAMCAYTIIFYILNKKCVFNAKPASEPQP